MLMETHGEQKEERERREEIVFSFPFRLFYPKFKISSPHTFTYFYPGEEPIRREIGVLEGSADRHFQHVDNHLVKALLHHLVEGKKHERTRFPGNGRSFEQQVLCIRFS